MHFWQCKSALDKQMAKYDNLHPKDLKTWNTNMPNICFKSRETLTDSCLPIVTL